MSPALHRLEGRHVQELLDIGADRLRPILVDTLTLKLRPTLTQPVTGWVGEHGILVPDAVGWDQLAGIGVNGRGWADVSPALSKINLMGALSAAGVPMNDGGAVGQVAWALEANGCVYFPVHSWEELPPYMLLPELDVGHRVVILRGANMGKVGVVKEALNVQMESYFVKGANFEHWVPQEDVGVLLDGDPLSLARLAALYPPGTPVWVRTRMGAGVPLTWRSATALEVRTGRLVVLREDGEVVMAMSRDNVAPGDQPAPPDGPPALTTRGTRAVGRVKPRIKRNVPPAK